MSEFHKLGDLVQKWQVFRMLRGLLHAAACAGASEKEPRCTQVDWALLTVPRYRDLIQDQDDEDPVARGHAVLSTAAGWRTAMGRWVADAEAAEAEAADNPDSDDGPPLSKWKKMTLAELFGGSKKKHAKPRLSQEEIDGEGVLMENLADSEALADAEGDARLDDGAVEIQSNDEYVG
ncbi:hypothetical protein B0H10DRAFT_1939670 [Mycena sp. CBHHK59/15]|nr:hypothetical protein B0H10DRAFT_1939670 [Mycena sp. CBHHK59/15]